MNSLKDTVIVACGTLAPELKYIKNKKILEIEKILYTKPGRHEVPTELEFELVKKINIAKKYSSKILVLYGSQYCYINTKDPYRKIDDIIGEQGKNINRIDATHCIDMLASKKQREEIASNLAGTSKVCWLTPGWILFKQFVFQDWDKAKANENFPKHTGGAILLDAIGFWDSYSLKNPEKILEFSDWMGIQIIPFKTSIDRFINLLSSA